MKSIESVIRDLNKTLDRYESLYEKYSHDQFLFKQNMQSWSLAQVLNHVILGAQEAVDRSIQPIIEGAKNSKKKKSFIGWFFFLIGGFPPIRVSMPKSLKGTKSDPRNEFLSKDEIRRLKEMIQKQCEDMKKNTSTAKSKHPVFGYLTAIEWVSSLEMHARHHLRQIKRIKSFLNKTNS